jgi:hypothetical protein
MKLAAMAMALPEQKEDINCPTEVSNQKILIFQFVTDGVVGGEGLEPPTSCV